MRGSVVCPLPFVEYDVAWCEAARGPMDVEADVAVGVLLSESEGGADEYAGIEFAAHVFGLQLHRTLAA